MQGQLWTIAYPVAGSESGEALHVATTRPETMLGDTAVAVHPDDDRYKHLIGRRVALPLTDRTIPIISDAILVDPKFGTGCVKVTPAHDPNDYLTGLRHDLEQINLLNPDGTFNENAGPYAGLDRRVVRKRVVADLEAQGLLAKVEAHANRVNYSDRSKTPIEPYLSDQWFVRMDDLAQDAMDAVTGGRGHDPPRSLREVVPRLARREARLVHQPATLVGPPHPDLVLRRRPGIGLATRPSAGETTLPARRPRPAAGSSAPRPTSPPMPSAHMISSPRTRTSSTPGSARPSGRTRPSAGPRRRPSLRSITPRASCPPRATSSASGWRGW